MHICSGVSDGGLQQGNYKGCLNHLSFNVGSVGLGCIQIRDSCSASVVDQEATSKRPSTKMHIQDKPKLEELFASTKRILFCISTSRVSVSDGDRLLLDQDCNPMRVIHPPVVVAYAATMEDDMFDSVRTAAQLNIGGPGLRKKATGVRPWRLLDSTDQAQIVDVNKHAIMHRTGLPARALSILDQILSYPSTVQG
ncbi:Magnesium transporter MRS2/LPE10 [Artemisia annua]|uniref:Magnesium transporter MRS2/LPE10 n=1 Tax=Artemisia annua TaxID=35608 RepID=A0A2U1LK54_ARTAN|nr:Magnesium transporter MRS2/LPE10 [Artemisia annua]